MNSFYKTKRWKAKRQKILKRDEYLCRECRRYGKSMEATTVHHVIPLAWCLLFKVALALASINLISLCEKCHNKMHDRDSNKLTALGLEWVKRLGKLGLEWIERYSRESW